MKEQENFPEEELDKMDTSNVLDREFRVMTIRILKGLKKAITIKKDQSEMKNAQSEINNTLEGIKSRLDEAEDHISNLEDKVGKKHPGTAAKRKKNFKI